MQSDEHHTRSRRGQSFVELAIFIPILILLLAGLVEVGFLFFSYMNATDLTREAARFASARDYRVLEVTDPSGLPESACEDNVLHYYYDTACFFIDQAINPYLPISPTDYADVTISVFSINADNPISPTNYIVTRYPDNAFGVFSLYNDNWRRNCQGQVVLNEPYFTDSEVAAMLRSNAPTDRGLVLVEVWWCYHQVLGLPGLSQVIENPLRMHAYTIMPASEAIPTATPIASP